MALGNCLGMGESITSPPTLAPVGSGNCGICFCFGPLMRRCLNPARGECEGMNNRISPGRQFATGTFLTVWFTAAFLALLLAVAPSSALGQDKGGGDEGAKTPASQDEVAQADADEGQESSKDSKAVDEGKKSDEGKKKVESQEDAEKAVDKAAEDVKKKADEAIEAVKKGDLGAAASKMGDLFKSYGIPAIVAIVILIVAYLIAVFLGRLCSKPIRSRVDETLGRFVGKLVFYTLMICAILGVLQYFGIGVTSFAAVLAAAGFAVGLAFQGTLSNFAAGVLLLVFRPFKVGDFVTAAGITAKVYEIDLFTTTFDTPDNRRIVVPNSAISSGTVENITFHQHRRVDVSVGVDYSADIQKTRDTLMAAAESVPQFLVDGEGFGYRVVLGDLGDSAVGWSIWFWTRASDFLSAKEALTAAVKNHLDEAGIGIPFPQMDVHMHQGTAQ